MRWYQHLFWRIFGAVWLVSMFGILVSLVLFLAFSDLYQENAITQERAQSTARELINDYEHGTPRERLGGHRLPIWIYSVKDNDFIYGEKRTKDRELAEFDVTAYDGDRYKVFYPKTRTARLVDRLVGFVLSFQVLWVLAVSFLSSMLVTWIVVRPINILRSFVRHLYLKRNLSTRAEGKVVERRDELGELAREFNSMADYVEQTLDTQQRLLQDVSHELRAPLARLQAAAGLAEQRWGVDDKSLQRIVRECGNLDALISEILSLAREAQEMADSPQESVTELLKQSIEEAQILGPNHSFTLVTSELRADANISREPLQRILSNLLNNAINHTSEGTHVTVTASSTVNTLKLVVSDTGEGVAPELLASLVEPFRRGKSSKGYGLGLSIVARAAERVGGSVIFSSPEGTGLSVEIKLPLATK